MFSSLKPNPFSAFMNNLLHASYTNHLQEAGVDEVGRGCLAGPVVAAAVILPKDYQHPKLTDSKQLTKQQRNELEKTIKKDAVAWAIAEVSASEIDEINIHKASILAMHRAIEKLSSTPELLLIDGKFFNNYEFIPHVCIIKGDQKYLSIAAASVLAKTYRDTLMEELSEKFPVYDWANNVGYPTPKHRKAILEEGFTIWHRKTFKVKGLE